jgi:hypothetical protein
MPNIPVTVTYLIVGLGTTLYGYLRWRGVREWRGELWWCALGLLMVIVILWNNWTWYFAPTHPELLKLLAWSRQRLDLALLALGLFIGLWMYVFHPRHD